MRLWEVRQGLDLIPVIPLEILLSLPFLALPSLKTIKSLIDLKVEADEVMSSSGKRI